MLILRSTSVFGECCDRLGRSERTLRYGLYRDDYPLLPVLKLHAGDDRINAQWSFHWLTLRLWSLDHFSFGVDVDIGQNFFGVGVILPYLRMRFGGEGFAWFHNLRRKPADDTLPLG